MNIGDIFTNYVSVLTLLADIGLVTVLILIGLRRIGVTTRAATMLTDLIGQHGFVAAFLISLGGLVGSMIYSTIIGYAPCDLCWWQRIFLYPQVFLLGLALWKKEVVRLADYLILLSALGAIVATYHSALLFGPANALPCPAQGGPSCTQYFFVEFGYIAIPTMSLTCFLLLLLCLNLAKDHHRSAR